MSAAPTNPYYQRNFDAPEGTLARSGQMRREFALIQRGFDLIGLQNSVVKFQLSASDLVSPLTPGPARAYLRTTDSFRLLEVRASVIQASEQGAVRVGMIINGFNALFKPIQIDEGQKTSVTSSIPAAIAYENVPDDAEVIFDILTAGVNAKGLIISMIGIRIADDLDEILAPSGPPLASGAGLQFQEEGANVGAAETTTTVDFVGAGVTASYAAGKVTVSVPGAAAPSAGDVAYAPAVESDWDGDADPGDVDAALDQLAARVKDVEGVDWSASTVTALATSAGVVNVDCALGDYFTLALSENVTSITFSNLPGAGKGATKFIRITQDATARTVAWPASFKWADGTAGAVSTASGAVDGLAITTTDNGATWLATLSKGFA